MEAHRYHRVGVVDREMRRAGGVFTVANRSLGGMGPTRKTRRPDLEWTRTVEQDSGAEKLLRVVVIAVKQ